MTMRIASVGSLNMDLVSVVDAAPGPGQTVHGSDLRTVPGGKGANQACAAGRLGGTVSMVGRVGDDAFGESLRRSLAASGVDVSQVRETPGKPSGTALIVVERSAQNRIIVSPGANATLRPEDVREAMDTFDPPPGIVLLQLETPLETVAAAAARSRADGALVVLDPAPVPAQMPEGLLRHVDILTPNESEALALLGETGDDVPLDEAASVAERLRALGPSTVILKMGAKGAFIADDARSGHVPAPSVQAVDTTAAGDTFNGALAVALSERRPLAVAVSFANGAAALSVTREGAQDSIPVRAEVEELLARGVRGGG